MMLLFLLCLTLSVMTIDLALTIRLKVLAARDDRTEQSQRAQEAEVIFVRGMGATGHSAARCEVLRRDVGDAYRLANRPAPAVVFIDEAVELTSIGKYGPVRRVLDKI